MRKWSKLIISSLLVLFLVAMVGCVPSQSVEGETRTYQSEKGPIKIPKNPKRVAVMAASYTGNLLALNITPVAVNQWPKHSKFFEPQLDKVPVITENNPEKLLAQKPDLIIAFSDDKNIKKYQEIAPTVLLTYQKYDYLQQHIEIGKIVGKEKEAKAWVDQWKQKAAQARAKVQKAISPNATASVFESYAKQLYLYGKNWGRGTEVIYQALGMKAPQKVEQDAFKTGYRAISTEVIPEYAGDFLFVGEGWNKADTSFMNTDVWKNIPAVKKGNVITFDSKSFYFNDPISLEKELDYIVNELVKRGQKG